MQMTFNEFYYAVLWEVSQIPSSMLNLRHISLQRLLLLLESYLSEVFYFSYKTRITVVAFIADFCIKLTKYTLLLMSYNAFYDDTFWMILSNNLKCVEFKTKPAVDTSVSG